MRHIRFSIVPLLCCLMIAGCGKSTVKLTSADKSQVVTLGVEVADNPTERARGLMERKALEPEKGMLFVFPEPQVLSFWMKDTLIPLEILFFDQDGQFVNSMLMEPCTQDPCTRYVSQALAQYAIEVLPDFRQKHGVGVGWSLDLKGVRKISRPT